MKNGCEESPINFVSWMVMGLPVSFINLFVIWIWLEIFFIGIRYVIDRSTILIIVLYGFYTFSKMKYALEAIA